MWGFRCSPEFWADSYFQLTKRPETGKGYFTLERAIFEDPVIRALTGESFVVFIWLSVAAWSHANSTGRVRASIDYIVLKTGVSRSTVSRALKALKDRHLIVCVEQNFTNWPF